MFYLAFCCFLVSSFECQVGGKSRWTVPPQNDTNMYNEWASHNTDHIHIYIGREGERRKGGVVVLPLLKLGTLVLKTLSKPIAGRLKQQAGLHPKFPHFIINIAQSNLRLTTTLQRRIYGHATDVEIRPLNEEKAVQAAGDLIGELFVFSVAGAVVIFEWQRRSRSEAKKEEIRRQELEVMRLGDEELKREVEFLKKKLEELEQLSKGRGLASVLDFKNATASSTADQEKSAKAA